MHPAPGGCELLFRTATYASARPRTFCGTASSGRLPVVAVEMRAVTGPPLLCIASINATIVARAYCATPHTFPLRPVFKDLERHVVDHKSLGDHRLRDCGVPHGRRNPRG